MFWFVLAAAVLLGLVAAAAARFGLWLAMHAVEQRHRALETVLATHHPPCRWLSRAGRRAAVEPEVRTPAAARRVRRQCQRRLRRLRQYVARSRLLADEETRTCLLDELAAVAGEWETADWRRVRFVPDTAAAGFGEPEC